MTDPAEWRAFLAAWHAAMLACDDLTAALPPETRVFTAHDYAQGRPPAWESTVAEQRATNIHVRDGIAEAEFVAMRTGRDATLAMPNLILPSVQVNIRAGNLPEPEPNGCRYLKLPLNAL